MIALCPVAIETSQPLGGEIFAETGHSPETEEKSKN